MQMKFPMIGLLNILSLPQRRAVVRRVITRLKKNNLNIFHEKL